MGWTVLHTAARDGDLKRIRRCSEDVKWLEKLDINAQTEQRGHTALHMCAANGHVEVMQYLMNADKARKDVVTHEGNSPLHLAAINAREKACKLLISNGFDVQVKNKRGKTAADVCPLDTLKAYLQKELEEKKSRRVKQAWESDDSDQEAEV